MVKLRGLDVSRYSEEALMRDTRDEGMGVGAKLHGATTDASGKTFLSSGARTLSSGQLRFHTDRCDVVGLLCVRQASEGGVSKLASSATVYNEPGLIFGDPARERTRAFLRSIREAKRISACAPSLDRAAAMP